MALIVSDNAKQYALPPQGRTRAVCVDVVEVGLVETNYGMKEKVKIVWEIDEEHPDFGGPFRVNKKYTRSLNEKANLCQDLESWRGRNFTEKEKKGFDLEQLIGVACEVNIVHNTDGQGRVWANVKAILPMRKGDTPLEPSGNYKREEVKSDYDENGADEGAEDQNNFAAKQDDDDLPF